MNHLNSILLEGVMVDKPRKIDLSEKDPMTTSRLAKFDVASDRYYMDKSGAKAVETVFIGVQCWNMMADRCMEKLEKGMTVRVVGRLRQNRWITSEGAARRSIEVVADHVEFRSPRSKGKAEILDVLQKYQFHRCHGCKPFSKKFLQRTMLMILARLTATLSIF